MTSAAEIRGKPNFFLETKMKDEAYLEETLGMSFSRGHKKSRSHFIEPASFGLGLKPFWLNPCRQQNVSVSRTSAWMADHLPSRHVSRGSSKANMGTPARMLAFLECKFSCRKILERSIAHTFAFLHSLVCARSKFPMI